MAKFIVKSHNAEDTIAVAREISQFLEPGMTIRLEGQLGAGKTTFTKGIAEGLGITRYIKSPTYTIIREYTEGTIPLYHIDLYRLDETGVEEIGLDEYLYGDGITVIEWGSVAEDSMPEEFLSITLTTSNDNAENRDITIESVGKTYENVVSKLHF